MSLMAVLVAGCVAAGGVSSPLGESASQSTGLESVTPPTMSASPCDPTSVDVSTATWIGATGSMAGGFRLRTTGAAPCVTSGPIGGVRILDADGNGVAIDMIEGPGGPPPSSALLLPDVPFPTEGGAPPDGLGSVAVLWSNWCKPAPTTPLSLRVDLGSGVVRTVPVEGGVPRCDAPNRPSMLTVFPVNVAPEDIAPLPTPSLAAGASPSDDWNVRPPLGISNGTTLAVTLIVNGITIGTYPPGSGGSPIVSSDVPPLPWLVEARSPSGRLLTSMSIAVGQVYEATTPNGGAMVSAALGRVDLSCGRLDIWAGGPALGPMPGPGTPGDCAP